MAASNREFVLRLLEMTQRRLYTQQQIQDYLFSKHYYMAIPIGGRITH